MISKVVKQFCKDPIEWIENYQEAVNDKTQTWHCHHRYEIEYNLSKIDLQALGFYFNRPFDELIFLTSEEHRRLHNTGENNPMYGKVGANKGKQFPEEWKAKMTKYHIPEGELYNLYIVQGLSTHKIAVLYGCSHQIIWHRLKKYNIIK